MLYSYINQCPVWISRMTLVMVVSILTGRPLQALKPLARLTTVALEDPVYSTWTARTPGQNKRVEGQSVAYNGKIYVFAGLTPKLQINNSNEVYDPVTNTWSYIAPMPLDPQGKPYAVTHNGIALVDNTVWLAGGRVGNNPGPVTDKVWIYNLTTNTWTEGPKLPAPRGGGGMVRLGRKLYFFGGFGAAICNDDRGDQFVYDLDNPAAGWQSGLAPLPNPRNHFGTVTVCGKIYAFGGQLGHDCGGGQDQKMVHEYDPATNTWTQKKDMPYVTSHMEPGSFALDGKIMVTGGERNGQNILQYDPATDTWKVYDQLPTALIASSAKVIGNYYIVSHGGTPGSQQSQEATWIKSITRTKSNVLNFWPGQLTASAPAGGTVTVQALLGTYTDATPYTINTASLPGWLTVNTTAGTTDEAGAPVRLTLKATGLAAGTYTHTLSATAPGYSPATIQIAFTVEGGSNLPAVLARINAGGPAVTTNGVAWSASQYFSGGKSYTNSKVTAIAGTDDDVLYLTEYSATTNLGSFTFAMPVPAPGTYTVRLHFAEIYWNATGGKAAGPGQRVFSVNLEGGSPELVNFDILGEVGSMTATVKTFSIPVTDGTLNIDFSATANQPKISAIEVLAPTTTNTPPVLASIGSKTVQEGSVLTVPVSATDADGDAVTITALNLPAFGSLSGNVLSFAPGSQAAGSYSITVRATDSRQGVDEETFTLLVNEEPSTTQAVATFTLINADNEQPIKVLTTGEVLNLATLPTKNLNIQATTNPVGVGSVRMVLSGRQSRTQTETGAPYALFGDNNGNYNAWIPPVGSYQLTGTPYTGASASGTAGTPLTISFQVINQAPSAKIGAFGQETDGESVVVSPNPFYGSFKLTVSAPAPGPQPVVLYDAWGRKVYEARTTQKEQLLEPGSSLAPGLYLLEVGEGPKLQRRKLLKLP
ncbi:malectin domain-containing carbohydrate-binding protein [Larkinella insperata]|uniref:Malectin domain-containing carbohydrate-binding protein n=1 Tax=Larkinella insperata TaxID=332158 RepID=A0ABW3QI44_9BACT